MPESLYEDVVVKKLHDTSNLFASPIDWRDKWIYFLMIDRFNNPAIPNVPDWNKGNSKRYEGKFEGVREKLDYIKDLGAGAIWLTPVFKNVVPDECHHGYAIMDFLEVDPRFGTTPADAKAEFKNLVKEAHKKGIYIILDMVINHAGNVFKYKENGGYRDAVDWSNYKYPIGWRDKNGNPKEDPSNLSHDGYIWPREFQNNEWFRRQGKGGPIQGDFESLKEFETEYTDIYNDHPVWNLLIRTYKYIIAEYDIDGFRIDTLRHVEPEFAKTFSSALREFAYKVGKKNFLIYGETKAGEHEIATYMGRFTSDEAGITGPDASLDFPIQWHLVPATKGFAPPTDIEDVYNYRKKIHKERHLYSTHGEASRFFVTFLECHDDYNRYLYTKDVAKYQKQYIMALGCLFCLQGIPCLYYGSEQGLKGTDDIYEEGYHPSHGRPENVREALWGKQNAFNKKNPIYKSINQITEVRNNHPAIRYGRQYFRPVSGNNIDFGPSKEKGGIIAFSRILSESEVVIVANTNVESKFNGWIVVDGRINDDNTKFDVLYSNDPKTTKSQIDLDSGDINIWDRHNNMTKGWARRIKVELEPMEIKIIAKNQLIPS